MTIRDVAARAGVSAATVSRVFSRPESVTVETRQRVLSAADELRYAPIPSPGHSPAAARATSAWWCRTSRSPSAPW